MTLEQLAEVISSETSLPVRPLAYEATGRFEYFTGRFGERSPEKALMVDPLRIYARARLPEALMPIEWGIVEKLMQRGDAIDPEAIRDRVRYRMEPVIVAQDFYGSHEDEIVDGNHTYVAVASAFALAQRELSMPASIPPVVRAFYVPPAVWRDFLADPATWHPLYGPSIARRMKGIRHTLPSDIFKMGRLRLGSTGPGRR